MKKIKIILNVIGYTLFIGIMIQPVFGVFALINFIGLGLASFLTNLNIDWLADIMKFLWFTASCIISVGVCGFYSGNYVYSKTDVLSPLKRILYSIISGMFSSVVSLSMTIFILPFFNDVLYKIKGEQLVIFFITATPVLLLVGASFGFIGAFFKSKEKDISL